MKLFLSHPLSLSHTRTDMDSISTVSAEYNKTWFHSHDLPLRYGMSKSLDVVQKDPDNDSLFTVTTCSDVYQDRGLGVDLNEKFYMKSVRPASK